MKKTIPISVMRLVLLFVLCHPLLSQSIVVLPHNITGVENCRIDLCGRWEFNLALGPEFWQDLTSQKKWKSIQVPGECQMQGYPIKHEVEYAYRRQIFIPKDFNNKRIFIRFNGVYSYARVWINGQFVRDHHGGFTTWDCDISKYVQPGEHAVLVVGITDRHDEISYGSGYAHHPIGGILRRVELVALPEVVLPVTNDFCAMKEHVYSYQVTGLTGEAGGPMGTWIGGTSNAISLLNPFSGGRQGSTS